MQELAEADIQALIALFDLAQADEPATPEHLEKTKRQFRRSLCDWQNAFPTLLVLGLVRQTQDAYALTESGRTLAARLRAERTAMWYWYVDYYAATKNSQAYAIFCERLFGRNFAQHGFSDMAQLDKLIEAAHLGPGSRVLDLGCGNGGMDEYIAAASGAHVTGIDYVPEAIRQAQQRAVGTPLLTFSVMDIGRLHFPPASFDVIISIDTLYFTDLPSTIRDIKRLLSTGGRLAAYYGYGAEPGVPAEAVPRETLAAGRTPLAEALAAAGFSFRAWDVTLEDYEHAQRKKQVLDAVRAGMEAEGNLFLDRQGEANGVMAAFEAGVHARYLYRAVPL